MSKKIVLLLSVIVFVCINISSLFSQSLLKKADKAFQNKDYYNAVSLYKDALKKEKDSVNIKSIYVNIAESYRFGNHFSFAQEWYEKAIESGCSDTNIYYNYANMLLINGNYDKAKKYFEKYLKIQPNDKKAQIKLKSIDFVQKQKQEHSIYEIKNEKKINSKYGEYGVIYIKDKKNEKSKIIFASSRLDKKKRGNLYTYTGQYFSDFYESTRTANTSSWKTPIKLKGGINSKYNDGSIFYDEKNNIAYFMQCNGYKGKEANCNIFYASFNKEHNTWGKATIFQYNNSEFSIGHPAFTSDKKTMYFVSDMSGGYGGKDIWMIKKNSDNIWSEPTNLGNPINTEGDEMFPYILGDTLFYYASDGNIGFGGLDIYYLKINDNVFSIPVNMGIPFNSCSDDFGIIFMEKNEGMFCSNRSGGLGDDDIYSFSLMPTILNAAGLITDKNTKETIENAIVTIEGSDGSNDSILSNLTGRYLFKNINPNVDYTINVKKHGYLSDSKTFFTLHEKYSKDYCKDSGYDLDFELTKIIAKEEIVIPEIYYDYDKWDLRDTSKISLAKIIKMLNENSKIYIRINSHTDERGTEAYNFILSDNRAQSVVNYLIEKDIDPARLTFKGWGKSNPIIVNAETEEDHQLNRRTTFNIVNADEVSSEYHKAQFKEIADKIKVKQELIIAKDRVVITDEDIGIQQTEKKEGLDFRVQFCASYTPMKKSYYKKIEDNISEFEVEYTTHSDGYYRYTIGSFSDFNSAEQLLKRVKNLDYKQPFIVAYNNGIRVTIKEAKQILKNP